MAYKDKEKQREFQRNWKRKVNLETKLKALEILGGKCKNCDVTDFRCIQFDHIVPEFRGNNISNQSFIVARKIILGTLTEEQIQPLCANCHAIKTYEVDRLLYKNRVL